MGKETNEYYIAVQTDKNLGDPSFVEGFLGQWLEYKDPKLRPEYFDLGEPIRKSFKEKGLQGAVRTWIDAQMPLMLRRGAAPKFISDINWRPSKGLDKRTFPWGCATWLALNAGDEAASELFRFLIEWFDPAFGMVTTWSALREKHWVQRQTPLGMSEKFFGLDVGETLPGMYWQTYFGNHLISDFPGLDVAEIYPGKTERLSKGLLVKLYDSSKLIGTEQGNQLEHSAVSAIGSDVFFHKSKISMDIVGHPNV